jgi:hypothetical protein
VNIHVRDLAQLFNSFDPSPFWDRDLDREAAGFIEDEFSDKRGADHWSLHVYAHEGVASAADLRAAIERYYQRLAASALLKLREQMRVGEIALLAGAAVFSICISLQSVLHGLPRGLDEGLIVLAWVALWRPIEILAYGWVPLHRKRRLYRRLARVQVSVRVESRSAPSVYAPAQTDPTPAKAESGSSDKLPESRSAVRQDLQG